MGVLPCVSLDIAYILALRVTKVACCEHEENAEDKIAYILQHKFHPFGSMTVQIMLSCTFQRSTPGGHLLARCIYRRSGPDLPDV